MKNQVMVWLGAASLHAQGRAPFPHRDLLVEVSRLFPQANPNTVASYVDTNVNVSGSLPNSFSYIIRTPSGAYRLTKPGDKNPGDKPRWPSPTDVDAAFADLWRQWTAWQADPEPSGVSEVQEQLARYLVALLPPRAKVKCVENQITIDRGVEIGVRIEPDRLWMQTMRTRWDCQTPVLQPDRELSLPLEGADGRGPDAAALEVIAVVQTVFGERLRSYSPCSDCGLLYPPEHMTDCWCHGCAAHAHGVVY